MPVEKRGQARALTQSQRDVPIGVMVPPAVRVQESRPTDQPELVAAHLNAAAKAARIRQRERARKGLLVLLQELHRPFTTLR